MKKFVAMYMASPELMAQWSKSSPEDKKKGMEEWNRWTDAHEGDFVDVGSPFGKNIQVSASGVKAVGNGMCGYSIVQASSQKDAVAIFADSPHIKQEGAWVDVMKLVDM